MKKSYLSQCVAAITAVTATSLAATTVQAQETEVDPNEEVMVVAGFRSSILNSIDVKRNADTIVEAVDAGDMASLPDASIADSLGRLPGVTTVRDSGQSSQLNIRGMNGDFIQTTLNGREQATTSAETESSRWMAFDQYPAELITQAAVYKSPKASLIEGGVAGSVELKTINPLEQEKEHTFTINTRYSYNDRAADVGADENGNRFTASYSGKFLEDTLGFSIGYSHLEQPNSFIRGRASADDQLGYAAVNVGSETIQVPRAYQFQAGSGKDTRDSLASTIVWEPSDSLSIKADYFATEFESEDIRHGVVIGSLTTAPAGFDVDPANIGSDGVFQEFGFTINDPHFDSKQAPWIESRTEDQSTQADSTAFGLNVEWAINDAATLTFDYSDSTGEKTRRDRLATMHAYDNYNEGDPTWSERANQGFNFVGNGDEIPTVTLTNGLDLADFEQMRLGRYEEYPHLYTDDVTSFRVDFKYELDAPVISSIEVGIRQSERIFDSERGTFLWGSRDGVFNNASGEWCDDNVSGGGDETSPNYVECSPVRIDDFASVGSTEGAPDHLVVDINGLADSIFGPGNYDGVKLWSRDWTFVESGELEEETFAYYLMANISTEIGNIPVTGNVGVRVVESDVKARGVAFVGNNAGDVITDGVGVTNDNYAFLEIGPEFTDTLPSLNLSFELTENDYLRFAAAKVMARPPVGQMKGGAGGWFDNTGDLNGDGDTDDEGEGLPRYNVWTKGTPFLDPFRADQIDISYEHYFEDEGAFSIALFYKDIETLVQAKNYAPGEVDFTTLGFQIPESAPADTVTGAFNTFENSEGGYIQGIEIAGTKTFTNLPGIFGGLGASASYSYTESQTGVTGGVFADEGEDLSLPGLSENVWSATGFWDIGNFSTHLNVRSRDEYVLNLAIPGSTTPVLAKEYTTVDWQMSYSFDMGIELVLQANNLTDEANKQDYGVSSALGEFNQYGRQFYVGLNYTF